MITGLGCDFEAEAAFGDVRVDRHDTPVHAICSGSQIGYAIEPLVRGSALASDSTVPSGSVPPSSTPATTTYVVVIDAGHQAKADLKKLGRDAATHLGVRDQNFVLTGRPDDGGRG